MGKSQKYDWIITVSGTDTNGTDVSLFQGTLAGVKNTLWKDIKSSMEIGDFDKKDDYGTITKKDIEVDDTNTYLYGYLVFSNYHLDFEARRLDTLYPSRK